MGPKYQSRVALVGTKLPTSSPLGWRGFPNMVRYEFEPLAHLDRPFVHGLVANRHPAGSLHDVGGLCPNWSCSLRNDDSARGEPVRQPRYAHTRKGDSEDSWQPIP